MRITTVTLDKQFKCGLPKFSNITASASVTWEVADGEVFDFDQGWDLLNHQLSRQVLNLEASWLSGDVDYSGLYKAIMQIFKAQEAKKEGEKDDSSK